MSPFVLIAGIIGLMVTSVLVYLDVSADCDPKPLDLTDSVLILGGEGREL